jgi:hypothetical protein
MTTLAAGSLVMSDAEDIRFFLLNANACRFLILLLPQQRKDNMMTDTRRVFLPRKAGKKRHDMLKNLMQNQEDHEAAKTTQAQWFINTYV